MAQRKAVVNLLLQQLSMGIILLESVFSSVFIGHVFAAEIIIEKNNFVRFFRHMMHTEQIELWQI